MNPYGYHRPASLFWGGRNRIAISGGGLDFVRANQPRPRFVDSNFDLAHGRRLIAALAFLVFTACATVDPEQRSLFVAPGPEAICINGQTFQGCCSGKGGVKNIRGHNLLCYNGDFSPTCKGNVTARLGGCCSHNEGIDYVATDGKVFCINESQSKTCSIYLRACEIL